jgi:uncharacterized protein
MKNKHEELIKEMSEKEILFHLYLTQGMVLLIAFVLGLVIYKDIFFFKNLLKWNDWSILSIGITFGLTVVIIDIFLMKTLPKSFYDDGGLNDKIFGNKNVFHIAWIALLVAFSEELLFRGIIQTELGMIAASIIFAIVHYRYLSHWFLLMNILLLSFFIGYVFHLTNNLAVTFMTHFIIDFLLGCLIMIKNKKLRLVKDVNDHESRRTFT